jgi:hypothetical protein
MHTCWCTSEIRPSTKCWLRSKTRIHQPISVSNISRAEFVILLRHRHSVERRLDEERLQIEAKKREREEQHLFLTAKACPFLHQLSVINSSFRSLRTTLSPVMRDSTWQRLTRRTGHLPTSRPSVSLNLNRTVCSSPASRSILNIPRVTYGCGCSSIARTRPSAPIRPFQKMSQLSVRGLHS